MHNPLKRKFSDYHENNTYSNGNTNTNGALDDESYFYAPSSTSVLTTNKANGDKYTNPPTKQEPIIATPKYNQVLEPDGSKPAHFGMTKIYAMNDPKAPFFPKDFVIVKSDTLHVCIFFLLPFISKAQFLFAYIFLIVYRFSNKYKQIL